MKALLAMFACLLSLSPVALSQTTKQSPNPKPASKVTHNSVTVCGADPVLVTDGTSVDDDLVPPGGTAYYAVNLKAGHSYAIELWDPVDQTAGVSPQISLLAADCNGAGPTIIDVTGYDPDISGGFTGRVSWIQTTDSRNHIVLMNPDMDNSYIYDIRITDTTLHSSRWSTINGYSTHYGFVNNTESAISGVLTVTSVQPIQNFTLSMTVPASSETFIAIPSSNFNVPNNYYGFATFAFVGPSGAVSADGYYQAVMNGILSIAPTAFGPVNRQH